MHPLPVDYGRVWMALGLCHLFGEVWFTLTAPLLLIWESLGRLLAPYDVILS